MKNLKRAVAVLLALAAVAGVATAQSGATGRGRSRTRDYTLTVNANVSGARIAVNGEAQSVTTNGDLTLAQGEYTITVSANGYVEQSQTVNLDSNKTVSFTLDPVMYDLTINANAAGARVLVNGRDVGAVGRAYRLEPGRYSLTVRAAGYQDYTQSLNLTRNQTVSATLQPLTATVYIDLGSVLNTEDSAAASKVQYLVDGAVVAIDDKDNSLVVEAGQRNIKIVSGGFAVVAQIFLRPGARQTLRPTFETSLE